MCRKHWKSRFSCELAAVSSRALERFSVSKLVKQVRSLRRASCPAGIKLKVRVMAVISSAGPAHTRPRVMALLPLLPARQHCSGFGVHVNLFSLHFGFVLRFVNRFLSTRTRPKVMALLSTRLEGTAPRGLCSTGTRRSRIGVAYGAIASPGCCSATSPAIKGSGFRVWIRVLAAAAPPRLREKKSFRVQGQGQG